MTLKSHARALYDSIRSMLGVHEPEHVQSLLEQELSRIVPVWREEKPDCAGWYWYKAPGISEPKLVLVDNGRIDAKLMADLGPPLNFVDVLRVKGQWAGPLLPPGG
jgi:hypothetical protein